MQKRVNGVVLNYEVFGDSGPWVVLSHSLMCDLTMWGPQIDILKNDYRVLAFDTRGHGGSEATEGPYSFDELALDSKALIDSLKIIRPHWIGLSMGGMIGMTYAVNFPGSFASLILCNTTSRMPPENLPAWQERVDSAKNGGIKGMVPGVLARWFTEPFLSQPRPEVEFVSNLIQQTSVTGYVGCCHAISKINCTSRLNEINAPIEIIAGDSDMSTPVAMSLEMQAAAPGSNLSIIAGASHLSNIEQPQQFNASILAFLGQHST